jgi:hypothetical protein
MDWLIENWVWVVGGVLVLVLVFVFTRPKEKKLSKKKQKQMAEAVVGLIGLFEKLVDDAIGQRYNREDRNKIAVGMVAIVVAENISPERLTDKVLLMAVMAKSVDTLTSTGEISTR